MCIWWFQYTLNCLTVQRHINRLSTLFWTTIQYIQEFFRIWFSRVADVASNLILILLKTFIRRYGKYHFNSDLFDNTEKNSFGTFRPTKLNKSVNRPWLDEICKHKIQKRHSARKIYNRFKSATDRICISLWSSDKVHPKKHQLIVYSFLNNDSIYSTIF
jgi:hypothetical protein